MIIARPSASPPTRKRPLISSARSNSTSLNSPLDAQRRLAVPEASTLIRAWNSRDKAASNLSLSNRRSGPSRVSACRLIAPLNRPRPSNASNVILPVGTACWYNSSRQKAMSGRVPGSPPTSLRIASTKASSTSSPPVPRVFVATLDRAHRKARQQSCVDQRGLAGPRRTKDCDKALRGIAQHGNKGVHLPTTAEENRRLVECKGSQARIR